MRNGIHSAVLVGICASLAGGATVSFDPPSITVSQGDIAMFRVTVAATDFAEFNSIDLLFGGAAPIDRLPANDLKGRKTKVLSRLIGALSLRTCIQPDFGKL